MGTELDIRLAPAASFYKWTGPATANPAVVERTEFHEAATGETAIASFRALSPGTSTLSAQDKTICVPACGAPDLDWTVTVIVVA